MRDPTFNWGSVPVRNRLVGGQCVTLKYTTITSPASTRTARLHTTGDSRIIHASSSLSE